jgi:hypothetical protein
MLIVVLQMKKLNIQEATADKIHKILLMICLIQDKVHKKTYFRSKIINQ